MTTVDTTPEAGSPTPALSYSALTEHRKCPQAWHYHYERRLESCADGDIPVERDFGSWWHALRAADTLQRGRGFGSLRYTPRMIRTVDSGPEFLGADIYPSLVLEAAEEWWRTLPESVREVWTERLGGQGLADRLEALYIRWLEHWEVDQKHEMPLARELYWRRILPGPGGHQMVGYVDEVFLDTRRNMVVVRDDKASSKMAPTTAADDMMDSQLQFYAWGATPIVKGWDQGPIRAVSYDRVRLTAPKTPVLTLAGTLSKSVTDYDVATYVQWASVGQAYPGRKKDGSDAGVYELDPKVVEKLSDPAAVSAWFQRTLRPLNVNVVRSHLRAAIDSAADLARTRERTARTQEAPRNLTRNCRFCDFVKLCQVEMTGGAAGEYDLLDYGLRERPPRERS